LILIFGVKSSGISCELSAVAHFTAKWKRMLGGELSGKGKSDSRTKIKNNGATLPGYYSIKKIIQTRT
jgi:hypothetical protein